MVTLIAIFVFAFAIASFEIAETYLSNHIYKFGSEAQKQKYLVPLAEGKKLGCWSLTEPEAGSDAGGTRTVASKAGGDWMLNGAKTFTTNGHYADVCVAMAVTDSANRQKASARRRSSDAS